MRASRPASLATKPRNGGRPAIDAVAMTATTATGRRLAWSPESCRRSRVWAAWSTIPTVMNSVALNSPWASSSAAAAKVASSQPAPKSATRNPSWLTVPWASSSLTSCCRSAASPPASMVRTPTPITTGRHQTTMGASTGANLATRYTPALTIVAECR